MELHDALTLAGLVSACIIGLINIYISIQNRRNSIREHLYKEQIAVTYRIFEKFEVLNKEIDDLFNNPQKKSDNAVEELQSMLNSTIYNYEFLLSNAFLQQSKSCLNMVTLFYLACISKKREISDAYTNYYNSYYELVKQTRNQFGIEALTKENETLHKLPANRQKLIASIAEEIFQHVRI